VRVVLLGTGAADGWPNPFCRCASCDHARSTGAVRTTTSALVDDALLVECGPDTVRQAARAGIPLDGVRTVLVTHAHHDHLDASFLLARSWARPSSPLRVVGPASVVEACRHWVGPHDDVELVPVVPGDTVEVDGYSVLVLAAAHDVGRDELTRDAVLFVITSADGTRLLWATDTGPMSDETLAALSGADLDLLLLEETFGRRTDHGTGHLDLVTFPRELARLRGVGAATDTTDVVAVHLGHHNPSDLDAVLAPWGARTVPDLTVLETRLSPRQETSTDPGPRRVLLVGGARSGKSSAAERLLAAEPRVRYVATGGTRDGDGEWASRVALHQARRPSSWETVETLDVDAVLLDDDPAPVLVDCLSLWLAGRLDRARAWDAQPGTPARAESLGVVEGDAARLVDALRRTTKNVVLVSNEVGSGVVPEHESGRLYRDLLGTLNSRVAAECDSVRLVVAGRTTEI
jgi:adenosylcobinamide kinase/adenosylcobinamide-phosphate guanylyltransferase